MVLHKKLKTLSTFELIKSSRTILTDWKSKTPNQKFCYLYSIGKMMFKPIGLPLFEEPQTIHWYSYCSYGVVGTYAMLFMYTAYYYNMQGEIEKCLSSTCLLGIVFCYVPFVWPVLSEDRPKYHSLVTFAGQHIYPDNHGRTEHNRICSQQMDTTMKVLIIEIILLLCSSQCGLFGPIYYYITQGIKSTTIDVKIPFVDDYQNLEYYIDVILQFVLYFHGFFIYIGMEVVIAILGNAVNVTPHLIKSRLNELNKMHERKEISKAQLRLAFLDITKQMLDYERFVSYVRDFLYWRTFMTPPMFTYSIAMAIFCQYTMDFKAGYGIAVMSWVQFNFICETGQDIEDNGLDDILYDSNWYTLPCKMQKDLMFLIHQRQNRISLNVGPFGVVNRDLLKLVTNKIYSFVMFLLNFTS